MDYFTIMLAKAGVSGWLAILSLLAFTENINSVILGALIALLIAFFTSLRRLGKMLIRFGEAIAKNKITTWAKNHGIDPEEILNGD
jgi:hypothetical protein